jgi:hypothetical protein
MNSVIKTVGVVFLGLIALAALAAGVGAYQKHSFAAYWEKRFSAGSISALPAVDLAVGLPDEAPAPPPVHDAKLVKKVFPDGSWFIVAEHDAHDSGEWDQAVFFDSKGRIRKTSRHFCGWEGLLGALSTHAKLAKSVDEFYDAANPELPQDGS